MKVFKISLLAALISSPLAAQTIDKTWEVGVFGDYIKSSTNKESKLDWNQIEAGKSIGIDLQKVIDDYWNMRIEFARTRYDIENGKDKDYGNRYGIDAIYKFDDSNLYTFAGVKRFNNVKSYNAINLGAGFSAQINDRFSVYSEAAVYKDVNYGFVDQSIKFGLKYAFGETKSTPVTKQPKTLAQPVKEPAVNTPKVTDTDNDGVRDSLDRCENTPSSVKVDSQGCTLYSVTDDEINLNIAFANNSSVVKPSLVDDIQRLADFMKAYPETSVEIEGHSSATGSEEYNLVLSQKRAEAVKAILIEKFGIQSHRLLAKGYGQTKLLSKENTAAAHQLNRRVVAKIETTSKEVVHKQ